MPRPCTVCGHPDRAAIDAALVGGEPFRNIAKRFETAAPASVAALHRHRRDHLPALLARAAAHEVDADRRGAELSAQARAQEAAEDAHALDVMAELRRCFRRVNLLFDACDRWLRDPADPDRYDIGPRAEDVLVIYEEPSPDGRPVRSKAPLSALLPRVEQHHGVTVLRVESKHADPRELVLKTAGQLQDQTELLAKLVGQLNEAPQVNVLVAPEWVSVRSTLLAALGPFPEARVAVASALQALEVTGADRG